MRRFISLLSMFRRGRKNVTDEKEIIRQMEIYIAKLKNQINMKGEQNEELNRFIEKASAEFQNIINCAREFCYRILESEIVAKNIRTDEMAALTLPQLMEKAISANNAEQKQTRELQKKLVEKIEEKSSVITTLQAQVSQLHIELELNGENPFSESIDHIGENRSAEEVVENTFKETEIAGKSESKDENIDLEILKQELTPEILQILEAIGDEGLSEQPDIINYCAKNSTDSNACKYKVIENMVKKNILSSKKIETGCRWFYAIDFTNIGKALFVEQYNKNPVESEIKRLIREHDNARHGYMIKYAAEILSNIYDYSSVSTSRKKNYIHLSNGKACIPDIIAIKEQNTDYFEVECGNHGQVDFNEKCNKLKLITKKIYFIVPDLNIMTRKLMPRIEKWIKESGAVNCVIVKDFSRLGRDHIGTGKYIERYFAAKNVRFIAVNEPYDSMKSDASDGSNSLIVPFKNIINEAFLEDISTKTKSQLAVKRKNGELVCNYAVFGYMKSADKKLIVDEPAAEIVRTIFEHKLSGWNEQQIADALNAKGILSPAEYKKASGQKYSTPFAVNSKSMWTANAVKRILTNRVYIGFLEQGKRTKASYRMKKCIYTPAEAWSVHEGDHEPIISRLDFELAQELMAKDTRISGETGQLHLFSGLMFCGNCGQSMTVKTTKKNGKSYVYYICSTHKRYGSCKNNNVSSKTVEETVLVSIRQQIAALLSAEELSDNIGLDTLKSRKKAAIEGMIETAFNFIQEHNSYLVKAYAHMTDGVISEDEYKLFREDFRRRISDAETNIAHMRKEIEQLSDDDKTRELVERFRVHGNITGLDRRTVVSLVHSIVVHSNKDMGIRLRYGNGLNDLSEYAAVQERAVV